MRNLTKPVDDLDLINGMDGRRQAAMNAKDLVADDNAQSQEVEHVREVMPDVGAAIFACAFRVEAVRLCDAS